MGAEPRVVARDLLVKRFRWSAGHADFSAALRDADLLAAIGPALAEPFRDRSVSAVVGMEARGFIIASLVALELDVGLVLGRKPGSVHPGATSEVAASPDWRGRNIEVRMRTDVVQQSDRLLLADDWIETGSQARTVARLVDRLGAHLVGVTVLVDDTTDDVRRELHVSALVRSDELPVDA